MCKIYTHRSAKQIYCLIQYRVHIVFFFLKYFFFRMFVSISTTLDESDKKK